MKKVIFLSLIFTLSIFGDYSNHIDSKIVIDELVSKHGFDKSYVIEVLKNACLLYTSPSPRDSV